MDGQELVDSDDISQSVPQSKTAYQPADEAGRLPIEGSEDYQRNVVTGIRPALNTRYNIPVEENGQTLVPNYSQASEDYQRNVVTAIRPVSPVDNDVHAISGAQLCEHTEQLQSDEHNHNLPKTQLRRLGSAWLGRLSHSLVYIEYNSEEVQTKSLEFILNFMKTCPWEKGTIQKFDLKDEPITITEDEIAKKMEILDEPLDKFLSHFSQMPLTSSIEFDNHAKLTIYMSSDSCGSNVNGEGGIGAYFIDENSYPKCVRYFNFDLTNYENKSNRIYKLHNNFREVLAILVPLKVWDRYIQNKVVFIRSDSAFACRLIRNVPGTKWSKPCKDREFFSGQIAAISKKSIIQPINIRGKDNCHADKLSRGNIDDFKKKIRKDGIKLDFDAFDKETTHHYLQEFDQAYERYHRSGN